MSDHGINIGGYHQTSANPNVKVTFRENSGPLTWDFRKTKLRLPRRQRLAEVATWLALALAVAALLR